MKALSPYAESSILAARPTKNVVDRLRPYAYLVERECQPSGDVDDVAVLFLTNRECPYRCLMCDLWKNTTDEVVPLGAIPAQIDYALERLTPAKHIKLYNSGNFFDPLAIPPADYRAIAERVKSFETVIVENHPAMCGARVQKFIQPLRDVNPQGKLEVAMGLETIHPTVLPMLNKQMTTDTFQRACDYLLSLQVTLRAFVLLKPPTLNETEGVEWAQRTTEFAFDCGVQTVSIIPTRAGNGMMDSLQRQGDFAPPTLASIETVLETMIARERGRVFMDLWDTAGSVSHEPQAAARVERLQQMNLTQRFVRRVDDE